MMKFCKLTIFCFILQSIVLSSSAQANSTVEDIFSGIYRDKVWGTSAEGEGFSGGGSCLKHTRLYRVMLQNFLADYGITSVVDVGCGDWEFSRMIDWSEINYTGFDVVDFVIEKNKSRYGTSNIQFVCGNGIYADLPRADLLICKDVLQHLSNEDVVQFITQLQKYKYCLITNDIVSYCADINVPINSGEYRPLDLTQPPFFLSGYKFLTYVGGDRVVDLKCVFLITN